MSFLVGDDDPTVVEEALAFIDSCGSEEGAIDSSAGCCEGDHGGADTNTSKSTTSGLENGFIRQPRRPDQPQTKSQVKKRRIKTFASSSTRQLQRKKAERLMLRDQVLVLQAQLDLLKRTKYAASTGPPPDSRYAAATASRSGQSEWYIQAVTQFVRRQQSEKTHRELKAILANQQHTGQALRAILQRRSVLDGMDIVFGDTPPLYRPPQSLDSGAGILNMLERGVENLYTSLEAGFGWDLPCLVSSKMNVNCNTQYGKVIEIETVTPVSCSIQEASAILWKDLKTVHEIPDKRYRYLRGSKPNSLEKNFVMKLRGQHHDIEMNGTHFSRKFEEARRIVIAKADSVVLPTQGLEFRSPSWTTITASEADPQHASVVRSYVRIYAEVQPNLSARPEDVKCARDFILNGLTKVMYGCAQKTQNELIQQTLVV
ncbi:hypothetical protein PC129_g20370 [Phytophthora cactorum]|uniref:M96 mating-specific protein family n=2 Tax=Phytophthora cactorum TaxID=29920 RepID=A0A329RMS3_9STRA|nr:hypothetical protein Pcac1_g27496 [Phytophthora cactorum]KAG2800862.1 hypothetical protein PC111_g19791 [Phytophthora cactorum]KAG2836289.1 hypothetical protein PC112_g5352 [Phytophthora cactorum]KAG2863929.1 hypothetical protein PC113_g5005 [Phytophthora cactorum]KAG2879635.1 hypothetical protein PC114_g22468 [Phytophthora cactorum]